MDVEPVAVNRFTITKSLFYEGMLRVSKERLGPFSKKMLLVLAGLWVALAVVTFLTKGNPYYVLVELAVIAAIGVWMTVYLPRNRAQRAWQAMEARNGGEPERITRFYPDRLEIENGGEVTSIDYENVRQILPAEHLTVLVCEGNVGVLIERSSFVTGDMAAVQALIEEKTDTKGRNLR